MEQGLGVVRPAGDTDPVISAHPAQSEVIAPWTPLRCSVNGFHSDHWFPAMDKALSLSAGPWTPLGPCRVGGGGTEVGAAGQPASAPPTSAVRITWIPQGTSQALAALPIKDVRHSVYRSSADVPKCHYGNYVGDIYVTPPASVRLIQCPPAATTVSPPASLCGPGPRPGRAAISSVASPSASRRGFCTPTFITEDKDEA